MRYLTGPLKCRNKETRYNLKKGPQLKGRRNNGKKAWQHLLDISKENIIYNVDNFS